MIHKYFAWKEGDYWVGQKLLPVSKIKALINLLDWKYQVFTSIQNYSDSGEILSCPIYFDLDGPPEEVLPDAQRLVSELELVFGVLPQIYFSGSKGFHVTYPIEIQHSQCHLIVKHLATELGVPSIDLKVYTPRRNWRVPNSPASQPGFYKIRISYAELFSGNFSTLRESARTQRFETYRFNKEKFKHDTLNDWVEEGIENLPSIKDYSAFQEYTNDLDTDITPCLEQMFNDAPVSDRNLIIFTLARFFKTCGLSEEQTTDLFMSKSHWKELEQSERMVIKVIRSTYASSKPSGIGCRGSSDTARIMKQHCHILCGFNPDFKVTFKDTKPEFSK